jgi:hypothetical protein
LDFSDTPSVAEIQKHAAAYNLKKDLEGIDTSLIIDSSSGRKRKLNGNNTEEVLDIQISKSGYLGLATTTGEGVDDQESITGRATISAMKKVSRHSYASDEEAEAEF